TLIATSVTFQLSFYVVSRGLAEFVGADTTQQVAGVTSQQAPNTTFNNTSLAGNLAFLLANPGSGSTFASAGSFAADGNGGLSSGVLDENSIGTLNANAAFNGTYHVASNGRGTASFTGGRPYVFYVGQPGSAFFQETDVSHGTVTCDGFLAQQQSASFSQALITGNYAIATSGLSGASIQQLLGEMESNGVGNVSSGAIDVNTGGTLSPGVAVTGAYATSSSAERGTLTLALPSPLNQPRD